MTTERVVVTGVGSQCALGDDWAHVRAALDAQRSAVVLMPQWQQINGLQCQVAAPLAFETPAHYPRRALRSMGRVACMAVRSAELALRDAHLEGDRVLTDGRTGCAYGSAFGSPDAALEFLGAVSAADATTIKSTSYLRMMSHTALVNIGVFFGITGRMIPSTSACTAGSQAIGFGFETIRAGLQDIMLVGGAEELTAAHCAAFDSLLATSRRNDEPQQTPRPFDVDRDGLVLGEGACTLVLESLSHALARGADILSEVVGFATTADGTHITRPNARTQARCLALALADAALQPAQIGYVNAHGTATMAGDISESHATAQVLGRPAISSLKGHLGHTLGACGALEAWITMQMLKEGRFAPTLNLIRPDPECAALDYLMGSARHIDTEHAMSNNFAFGGINTSLVLRRWQD